MIFSCCYQLWATHVHGATRGMRLWCCKFGPTLVGIGTVVLQYPMRLTDVVLAATALWLLGALGKGDVLVYPAGRVPTYPLIVCGASALGSMQGEVRVCKYHGRTAK